MPHIVLEQAQSTLQAFTAIEAVTLKTEAGILKLGDKYINAAETSALIEALAIEAGKNQNFFIQLSQKKGSITVRLLPLTDPEKSPGVKRLMAMVAKQVKESNPSISYGKTNLQDYLVS